MLVGDFQMLGFDAEKWEIIPSFPRLPARTPAFIAALMRYFNHAPPKAFLVGAKEEAWRYLTQNFESKTSR